MAISPDFAPNPALTTNQRYKRLLHPRTVITVLVILCLVAVAAGVLVNRQIGPPARDAEVPEPSAATLTAFTPDDLRPIAPASALALNESQPVAPGANPAATAFGGDFSGPAQYARSLDCMTDAIYYEAGNESDRGQAAVAQVILNRVSHVAYPNSVCGVIYQGSNRRTGCQFSFTCDGSLARRPSSASRDRARRIAENALSGSVSSAVGRSTHYHANYVVPYWSSSLIKTAVIGAHIFYRSPGRTGNAAAFLARYARTEPVIGAVASTTQLVLPQRASTLSTYSPQMTDPKVMDVPEDSARALDRSDLLDYKSLGNRPLPSSAVEPQLESALNAAKVGTGKSETAPRVQKQTSTP